MKSNFRLGTVTSVFRQFDFKQTLKLLEKTEFDFISVWGGRPHIYKDDYSCDELLSFRKSINDMGMNVETFFPVFYESPHNLSSNDKYILKESKDYVRKCIDNARILGAKRVLICAGKMAKDQEYMQAWDTLNSSITELLDYAVDNGLSLSLEPIADCVFDLLNTAEDVVRMIKEISSDSLTVSLDTGHINLGEEKLDYALKISRSLLVDIHIDDNNGLEHQCLIPGKGNFPFEKLFNDLRRIEYNGCITIELGRAYVQNPEESLAESVHYLKQFF